MKIRRLVNILHKNLLALFVVFCNFSVYIIVAVSFTFNFLYVVGMGEREFGERFLLLKCFSDGWERVQHSGNIWLVILCSLSCVWPLQEPVTSKEFERL